LIDQDRCIGCKFCIVVCPFGVIGVANDSKVVVKCDLCIERTKAGQEPACVEACPTKALKLVDEKDLAASKRRLAARELALSAQPVMARQSRDRQDKRPNMQKENIQ
jgi:carbon-monoxide dehydrogenase iron sulfur subunit